MGAAIGLLSLLITVALILWLMVGSGYLGAVSKQNQTMRQQVNVMGGKDETGTVDAIATIVTRVDRTGGKAKLLVSSVTAGGPMDRHYGIRPGDRIVEIGGLEFGTNIDGRDAANDWIATAYARRQPIVVLRGAEKLTLPTPEHERQIAALDKQAAAAAEQANATAGAAAAAPPTPAQPEDLSSIQKALDKIRSTPGQ